MSDLASVRTFPQLLKYLKDELDWPIESDDFEDLTFDYTPEELGIDSKSAAKIQEIKRLRPLTANQHWGVLFIKFEPKKLPIVALRRILNAFVLKKRQSANPAERTAWDAEDLLFISTYGEGDARQITFAHFSQGPGKEDLPSLNVLGWNNLDTLLHIDDAAGTLMRHLVWPKAGADFNAWRDDWRSAFTLRHREVITTSHDLSIRLAALARAIRDRIHTALAIESESGPLTKLMTAFREALVHDLNTDGFADMYAQTIAYGLLSARIANPKGGSADALAHMTATNPFLKELMETFLHVGGRRGTKGEPSIDFDELGVSEIVQLLDDANMEAVVLDFGDRNPEEDPVIHFYEAFLAEYDKKQKIAKGVFYTPRPVVSQMVRWVDGWLRDHLGLEDGLADPTTWGELASRLSHVTVPEDVDPNSAFVQVVDPATGTGTYLVEVIDVIHTRMLGKWTGEDKSASEIDRLWNRYVEDSLLPRLYGYEVLMAPYAIAHLKIGLKLHETGYRFGGQARTRVYLTNTLEYPGGAGQFDFAIPALTHESEAVYAIKRLKHFTVVIGNPPYKEKSKGLGGWIESGDPPSGVPAPLKDFVPPTAWGVGAHVKHLYNPYVYFWRWGLWQAFDRDEHKHPAVVCLITVSGFLNGPGFQQMRARLREEADAIYVLDCSPEGHQPAIASRVFEGVQQPLCVTFVGRTRGKVSRAVSAHVRYRQLRAGLREEKFVELASVSLDGSGWESCGESPRSPFLPASSAEWNSCPSLDDVLRWSGSGIMPGRTWVISPDAETLRLRWDALVNAEDTDKPGLFMEHVRDRPVTKTLSSNLPGFSDEAVRISIRDERGSCPEPLLFGYRSFDRQWLIPDKRLINQPNPSLWAIRSGSQVFLTGLQTHSPENGPAVTFSALIPDLSFYRGSFGGRTYPLYLDRSGGVGNVVPAVAEVWGRKLGCSLSPPDVFAYIAAMMSHPAYTNRFADELRQPGLRIPLTSDSSFFREALEIGFRVLWLHSFGERFIDAKEGRPPGRPRMSVPPAVIHAIPLDGSSMPDDLGHDPDSNELLVGSGRISNVSAAVFGYEVSGVNVLGKWFSYRRKTRTLPQIGAKERSALERIHAHAWKEEYTAALVDVLNVLGLLVDMEPMQAALLEKVMTSPRVATGDLEVAGALPVSRSLRKAPSPSGMDGRLSL